MKMRQGKGFEKDVEDDKKPATRMVKRKRKTFEGESVGSGICLVVSVKRTEGAGQTGQPYDSLREVWRERSEAVEQKMGRRILEARRGGDVSR